MYINLSYWFLIISAAKLLRGSVEEVRNNGEILRFFQWRAFLKNGDYQRSYSSLLA